MYIKIRPLEEKDAYTSWKWRNDPEVFANTGRRYSGPVTLEEELNWIRTVLKRPDERRFAILIGETYIGNMYLTNITEDQAEVSTLIGDKRYWNKIAGFKAFILAIQYAFDNLKLKNVITIGRKEHIRALKFAYKVGFTLVHEDEEFYYFKIDNDDFKKFLNDFRS